MYKCSYDTSNDRLRITWTEGEEDMIWADAAEGMDVVSISDCNGKNMQIYQDISLIEKRIDIVLSVHYVFVLRTSTAQLIIF